MAPDPLWVKGPPTQRPTPGVPIAVEWLVAVTRPAPLLVKSPVTVRAPSTGTIPFQVVLFVPLAVTVPKLV